MIRRRRVVYLMGFDPRGSSFYYQLLKREVSRSKRRGFSAISVSALQTGDLFSECQWQQQDGPEGDYRFAEMLDLITPHFRPTPGASWWWWLQLCFHMLRNQMFWQGQGQSWKFGAFMAYPLLFLGVVLIGIAMLAWTAASATAQLWSWPLWCVTGMLLTDFILQRFDRVLYLRYLLGDFLFTKAVLSAQWDELEQRIQQWALQLVADLQALDADEELLIVGHSSGGLLATRLAAEIRQQLTPEQAGRCLLLTLGNQASTGLAPKAFPFHRAVQQLTAQTELAWLEVFAPQDIICSGRFDAGRITTATPGRIRLCSALWREALPADEYAKVKFQFFHLHLQYLRSSVTGAGFDYLKLLASKQPASRYQPERR